ncbi:MAG: response regulator [Marmoricola sp.]
MSSSPASDPLRVVVVDDTPDLRDLMRMALERSGDFAVVGEAGNGAEGVEVADLQQPDVVFLDIAMPVMDGLEALPRIRAACPGATIVMLSGFGASEMTARALQGGADGYIQKGQPLNALLAQARTLVARSAAERDGRPAPAPVLHVAEPPAVDHLELAPFGFVHVRRGRIIRANREADRLLGDLSAPELGLAAVSPRLAALVADDAPLEAASVVDLGDPPRRVLARVRRSGEDHALYLQAQAGDEVELLRRAIATAAHEIRGPVGVLMGVAETLSVHRGELNESEQDRMMRVIGRQTRLLDSITADLLAAGEAQHGTLALQLQPVDTVELVRSLLDDTFQLVVTGESRVQALTDPLRFQQMLTNLVSNAGKYGSPPFLVRVTSQGGQVCIDVEDNGPGVPEDFRPRLFQEYSRAPNNTARGTGLGLFVVRALVEAQGGSVAYTPRLPHGSVFSLRLPAVPT